MSAEKMGSTKRYLESGKKRVFEKLYFNVKIIGRIIYQDLKHEKFLACNSCHLIPPHTVKSCRSNSSVGISTPILFSKDIFYAYSYSDGIPIPDQIFGCLIFPRSPKKQMQPNTVRILSHLLIAVLGNRSQSARTVIV